MSLPNRKSPRAQWYDYTSPGGYFITICTKDRKHYFGEIEKGEMRLNELGEFVTNHRQQIPDHYPFVVIDAFVCMPNHIHGILLIGEHTENKPKPVGTQFFASDTGTPTTTEKRTYKNMSLPSGKQPSSGSLGAIMRGFKIGITKYAKQHTIPFQRQSRYHDRIIRNESEYNRIKHYIQQNPSQWEEDMFYERD